MANLGYGEVSIHYEVLGSGPPLLLLAPGGLNSTIEFWGRAALNPIETYADEFQLIAMDQRNAGSSTGPFQPADPWGSFIDDQLALVDHLGIDRFLVMGCCIGCSYALKLVERAPERVLGAVLEQPIGMTEENRPMWLTNRRSWVENLVQSRSDLDAATGEAFGAQMWDDAEFVVSVSRDFVRSCATPLVVLPGVDAMHPGVVGREIGELASDVVLVEPWKESPDQIAHAATVVREFLHAHAPH